MFGIKGKSRRIMKNKCERKGALKKRMWMKGKNGVDGAATKFQVEDSVERIKGLIST